MKALIGKKLGMTQIVDKDGQMVPVTIIEAQPSSVIQVKNMKRDGYSAVQLGSIESKKLNKAQTGHLKQAAVSASKLKEFRLDVDADIEVGTKFGVDEFSEGDEVKVSGTSKGKGFAGTIKRWNFSRGPESHGSHNVRAPGSIGSVYPQKVLKGKKMPGRMGGAKVTIGNAKVAFLDNEKNLIGIKGAVPGPNKGIVYITGKMEAVAK